MFKFLVVAASLLFISDCSYSQESDRPERIRSKREWEKKRSGILFSVEGVKKGVSAAAHDFPEAVRKEAYDYIDQTLRNKK